MAQKRFLHAKRSAASGKGANSGGDGLQAEVAEVSFTEKIAAILRSGPLVNSVVSLAIGVGFIHGWLKIRFPSSATTFVFDALLLLALFLVFFQEKRITYIVPPGKIGSVLKPFYIVCAIYLFLPLPDSPPILIALAAARGWCFATLMYILGYKVTRSIGQVKGYFYVVIALGVFTAFYGIRQTPEEVEKQMQADANFAERYQQTYYQSSTQGRQLRRFSTFVSSGAFGSTMAYIAVFAIALITDPRCPKFERYLLGAAILPVAYGVVLSGSRSPLISLGCGVAIIAWHRRSFVNFVLMPAAVILLVKYGVQIAGGAVMERYATLLDFEQIWYRQFIPMKIGWDFMLDNLLGGGIGRSGHSVPMFFSYIPYHKYVGSDGDLGRLMIDMGIVGVVFFGNVIWTALRDIYEQLQKVHDTPVSTLALACAACFVMAVVTLPSGSPFLGVPMGALVWFFMGTFSKLVDEQKRGSFSAEAAALAAAAPPPKRFLYHRVAGDHAPGK